MIIMQEEDIDHSHFTNGEQDYARIYKQRSISPQNNDRKRLDSTDRVKESQKSGLN